MRERPLSLNLSSIINAPYDLQQSTHPTKSFTHISPFNINQHNMSSDADRQYEAQNDAVGDDIAAGNVSTR